MSELGVTDVLRIVDRALPFTTLATTPSPATVWCADVIDQARLGGDPLAPWRAALAARQNSTHRPHVAAAFVLQWWCEIAATPMAYAAELASVVLVPSPTGLGFEVGTNLVPQRIVLLPEQVSMEVDADGPGRAGRSRAAYDLIVGDVVGGYAPDIKMSSRQRWGVVDDMWVAATRTALGAAGRQAGPTPRRTSCCFIVGLPGMSECAGCPRSGHP